MLAKLQNDLRTIRDRKNDNGFTLIELLIVVLIIGILAAIVVVAVGNQQSTASTKACNADAAALVNSLDHFKLDNGDTLPAATGGTVTSDTYDTTGWTAFTEKDLVDAKTTGETPSAFIPNYLKNLPAKYGTADGSSVAALVNAEGQVAAICILDGGTAIGLKKKA